MFIRDSEPFIESELVSLSQYESNAIYLLVCSGIAGPARSWGAIDVN